MAIRAKKKKKKTIEVKRCVEMFTDEVSMVTRGANGHRKFLMVKSDGEVGQIIVDNVEKSVPAKDASRDSKDKAQKARSKKYGIEVLPKNSNLSYPANAPSTERLYGDPVNLKYPLAYDGATKPDEGRTKNAISRFKGNYKQYSKKASQARIYERIVRAAMGVGIKVNFDPKDPIDSKLPGDIKSRIKKDDSNGPDTDPAGTDSTAADDEKGFEVSDWLQGLSKSAETPDGDDNWLASISSALDPVDEGQAPEEDLKKEDSSSSEEEKERAESSEEPVKKSDDEPNKNSALEKLEKELKAKNAQIDDLTKSVRSMKADIARHSTHIDSPRTMLPGAENTKEDSDPYAERNSSIDLSPALD
ncbi:MAG: hypothetical protein GY841_15340 [FCB group bacterium]|nr:hypothetical protein [FCB group bacterium]